MQRDEAWALLCEHTKSDSLRKHGLAVEAAMRHFAAKFGEDEEVWGVTGLLHDLDYERDPDGHPQNGKPILEQAGVPGAIAHAIQPKSCSSPVTPHPSRSEEHTSELQ